VVRHFLAMRVEAVVFIGHFHQEEIEARIAELTAHGTPHLVIDHFGLKGANTVSLDRASGMEAMMNLLLDHGHRRFGLLGISKGPVSRLDRLSGIQAALRGRGLDFAACTTSVDHLHERQNDFQYGRKLAGSFLEIPNPPTAFVGYNDEIAIGALRGLQEGGIRLPRDASITGFNNQDICLMTSPTLTTVDQSIDTTIATAADLIFSQLDKPPRAKPMIKTIEPRLIIGDSTGPVRG
jgi:DNA-binding LacI/PurR family transcriptional regulator